MKLGYKILIGTAVLFGTCFAGYEGGKEPLEKLTGELQSDKSYLQGSVDTYKSEFQSVKDSVKDLLPAKEELGAKSAEAQRLKIELLESKERYDAVAAERDTLEKQYAALSDTHATILSELDALREVTPLRTAVTATRTAKLAGMVPYLNDLKNEKYISSYNVGRNFVHDDLNEDGKADENEPYAECDFAITFDDYDDVYGITDEAKKAPFVAAGFSKTGIYIVNVPEYGKDKIQTENFLQELKSAIDKLDRRIRYTGEHIAEYAAELQDVVPGLTYSAATHALEFQGMPPIHVFLKSPSQKPPESEIYYDASGLSGLTSKAARVERFKKDILKIIKSHKPELIQPLSAVKK
jgi:ElaB/YqjD/DUF883 family membrane-anchored ribosome-binding protein